MARTAASHENTVMVLEKDTQNHGSILTYLSQLVGVNTFLVVKPR